jgi:hypothetical protein
MRNLEALAEMRQRGAGSAWMPFAVRLANPVALSLIAVNVVLLLAAGWAFSRFGSIRATAGYYFRGESLAVDAPEKFAGLVAPGRPASVTFRLKNVGNRAIRVLGYHVPCSCIVAHGVPFTLRSKQSWDLTVAVRHPRPQGSDRPGPRELKTELTLYTNAPGQSRLPLIIRGTIRGERDPPGMDR